MRRTARAAHVPQKCGKFDKAKTGKEGEAFAQRLKYLLLYLLGTQKRTLEETKVESTRIFTPVALRRAAPPATQAKAHGYGYGSYIGQIAYGFGFELRLHSWGKRRARRLSDHSLVAS